VEAVVRDGPVCRDCPAPDGSGASALCPDRVGKCSLSRPGRELFPTTAHQALRWSTLSIEMDSTLETTPSSTRSRRVAATGLVVLAVACSVLTGWTHRDEFPGELALYALILCEIVTTASVGWLIVRRHPHHVVGWLLLTQAVFVAVVLSGDDVPHSAAAIVITQLGQGCWVLLFVCLALIGYLFPDGRFLSPRWRRYVFACLAGHVLFLVGAALDVASFRETYPGVEPQYAGSQTLANIIGLPGLLSVPLLLVGAVVSARARLRRANAEQRVQMLWFTWAALAIPGGLGACWLDFWLTGDAGALTIIGITITGSLLPIAIGLGILRHRLFDIELVLSRTLTYGVLTVLVVLTYAAVLTVLGSVVNDRGAIGLVAVGIVAVAIQPVHARVRRRVQRWVYGDRSDPYAALRRLSERLETTLAPAQVIETVTGSVAEALRVDDVSIELDRDVAAGPADVLETEVGSQDHVVRAPLTYQGEHFGELVVHVPPGRVLGVADRQLLDDLARHAAVIVNAVHLTLDLQHSRARLVTAQEEERRRLRRDLHDGLGPTLAAIVLKLNAVGAMVRDPSAGQLIVQLRQETRAAIADIRRLVDDLRPPALDEVGLVAALQQRAASLSRAQDTTPDDGDSIVIDVAGPSHTTALPAAVEVAAYRIATEALTNVVRHSGAARASVEVSVNGSLEISVADNGNRPWDATRVGVGLASMRERAEELGGSCTVSPRPEGGTVVHATLPLPRAAGQP
jgi:two-component system NarL family sensor kinase